MWDWEVKLSIFVEAENEEEAALKARETLFRITADPGFEPVLDVEGKYIDCGELLRERGLKP